MAEITLHLNDYRMEALEEALEDSGGVEKTTQDYLIDLYSETVPFEKQREIQKRIDAERQLLTAVRPRGKSGKNRNPAR